MNDNQQSTTELEFSEKYNEEHALYYFHKHEHEFWRRLSNWRDHRVCAKALRLAGNPKSVLDMPCGTGRFWDLLVEDPERKLWASDNSQDMINTGLRYRRPEIAHRFETFQGSAFDLPVADNFVESVFCIRLMHHIGEHEDRMKLLAELARVSSDSIIISLWVDGNLTAWKRQRREAKRKAKRFQNRFVIPRAVIEQEFQDSGLSIAAKLDFIPYYAMWRTYVLKVN
ncbi:MAG: class I SAM-dependent methyltransferase [Gammaproteobacteria bacterium]